MLVTDSEPFDRQPGEPPKAYHAFCRYRDLGPVRSLDRAWRQMHPQKPLNRRSKTWAEWSRRWGWVDRAAAYDAHLERQKRDAFRQEQIDATRRHARTIQAAIAAATTSIRIALETATTPTGLATLRTAAGTDAVSLRAALAEARHAAMTLPSLVAAERLTLGMVTSIDEVRDERRDNFADRIVSNSRYVELASELLDELAGLNAAGTPPGDAPLPSE